MPTKPLQFTCPQCGKAITVGIDSPGGKSDPNATITLQCLKQYGVGCGWKGVLPVSLGRPQQ